MTAAHEPIERRDYVTAALMAEYRPAWQHPNKRIVFEIACPPGAAHGGRLAYSRWTAMPVPTSLEGVAAGRLVRVLDGYYDYASSLDQMRVVMRPDRKRGLPERKTAPTRRRRA